MKTIYDGITNYLRSDLGRYIVLLMAIFWILYTVYPLFLYLQADSIVTLLAFIWPWLGIKLSVWLLFDYYIVRCAFKSVKVANYFSLALLLMLICGIIYVYNHGTFFYTIFLCPN